MVQATGEVDGVLGLAGLPMAVWLDLCGLSERMLQTQAVETARIIDQMRSFYASDVVQAVNGRVPVLIDGGFRRGTDVIKALALGANAVCIGRPYVWGLAAFGEPGVTAVLAIMQREFETIMRQVGATKLAEITPASVSRA